MISRSVSGDGERLNADMIHRSLGETTSRARIAAPDSQFRTMRIRRTTYAIGNAADDEAGLGMTHHLVYRISINYLSIFVKQDSPGRPAVRAAALRPSPSPPPIASSPSAPARG